MSHSLNCSRQSAFSGLGSSVGIAARPAVESGRKLSNHDKWVPIRLALLVTELNLIGGGERFLDWQTMTNATVSDLFHKLLRLRGRPWWCIDKPGLRQVAHDLGDLVLDLGLPTCPPDHEAASTFQSMPNQVAFIKRWNLERGPSSLLSCSGMEKLREEHFTWRAIYLLWACFGLVHPMVRSASVLQVWSRFLASLHLYICCLSSSVLDVIWKALVTSCLLPGSNLSLWG